LEEILTHNFLGVETGLKFFFYLFIGDSGGVRLKGRTAYTLKLLFESPLKA